MEGVLPLVLYMFSWPLAVPPGLGARVPILPGDVVAVPARTRPVGVGVVVGVDVISDRSIFISFTGTCIC